MLLKRLEYKLLGPWAHIRREHQHRRQLNKARRRGAVSPTEAAIRLLESEGFIAPPVVALEPFGMCGLRKTIEYAHRCDHLEFFEHNPIFARHARRVLRGARVNVRCEDSIKAIREKTLSRNDFNFVFIDNPAGCFGSGYCENFDLFPHVFEQMAPAAAMVINGQIDDWVAGAADQVEAHRRRRREFFGGPVATLDELFSAYAAKVPPARFESCSAFALPHEGPMAFVVLCLGPRRGLAAAS